MDSCVPVTYAHQPVGCHVHVRRLRRERHTFGRGSISLAGVGGTHEAISFGANASPMSNTRTPALLSVGKSSRRSGTLRAGSHASLRSERADGAEVAVARRWQRGDRHPILLGAGVDDPRVERPLRALLGVGTLGVMSGVFVRVVDGRPLMRPRPSRQHAFHFGVTGPSRGALRCSGLEVAPHRQRCSLVAGRRELPRAVSGCPVPATTFFHVPVIGCFPLMLLERRARSVLHVV